MSILISREAAEAMPQPALTDEEVTSERESLQEPRVPRAVVLGNGLQNGRMRVSQFPSFPATETGIE